MFDPNYKLKHRVTPIRRLLRYERLPPPMIGDPRRGVYGVWLSWDERCRVIYEAMMAEKRGTTPPHKRRGLWAWYDAPERSADAVDDRDDGAGQSMVDLPTFGAI